MSWRCVAHIGKHELPSSRNPAKTYTVTFNSERDHLGNEVWCDCPAWRFQSNRVTHGERATCKHIDAVFDAMCGWDQAVHGEAVRVVKSNVFKCPFCGGDVEEYTNEEGS